MARITCPCFCKRALIPGLSVTRHQSPVLRSVASSASLLVARWKGLGPAGVDASQGHCDALRSALPLRDDISHDTAGGWGGTLTNDYGKLPETFQGHHLPSAVIPHSEPVPTLLTGLPKWRQGARLLSWSSSGHRFALPRMHAWQNENHQLCLVEQSWNKGGTDPKALACHGVLWQEGAPNDPQRDEMWLRFVTGRPKSRSS